MKISKNPYEIRADLLRLAFDVLKEQNTVKYQNNANNGGTLKVISVDDVVAEAKRLNEFVSQSEGEK